MTNLIIILSIIFNSFFIGTVQSPNHATALQGNDGYYFEQSLYNLGLEDNDTILVIEDQVYKLNTDTDIFIGTVANNNHINGLLGGGYYLEEGIQPYNLQIGDTVLIIEGDVYCIDAIE